MVYFRFRSAQKLTTPMAQATATAASIAISVVMNGASAGVVGSGTVGINCCDDMDADGAVSPDINLASPKQ